MYALEKLENVNVVFNTKEELRAFIKRLSLLLEGPGDPPYISENIKIRCVVDAKEVDLILERMEILKT